MKTRRFFHLVWALILAVGLVGIQASPAHAVDPQPIFDVTAATDWISGSSWPASAALQIFINDPATPANPDHTINLSTSLNGDFSQQVDYDIQVGFGILVTDGTTIKQLTVSNVKVVTVDWVNLTLSGTGTPGAAAATWVLRPGGWIPFDVAPDGTWQVDLSSITGFTYDTWGYVIERDANGDGTLVEWAVPSFHANIAGYANNHIDGFNWPHGDSVTVTVDDPATPASPDFTDTQTAGAWNWLPYEVRFVVQGLDLAPGQLVTMTNGDMTKTLTIQPLAVTEANYTTDIIRGTATAGSEVRVELYCDNCPFRLETADGSGNWTADFSVAGDQPGEDPYDITPDVQVGSMQVDADGDTTRFDVFTANPWFFIWFSSINQSPLTGIGFDVHGYAWPLNTPVTLTIDKLETPASPDYTGVAYMEVPPWGGDPQLVFDTNGIIVHTGDIFIMTDGMDTITHAITALTVSELNPLADTVSGAAEPGSLVNVSLSNPNTWRNVTAAPDGTWLADFSVPGVGPEEQNTADLVPGTEVWISQSSADAVNCYPAVIPNPHFKAWPNDSDERIEGFDWPFGATVAITIDDPLTPQNPDLSANMLSDIAPWNQNETYFEFFTNGYNLKPGDIVTMTDGMNNRTTTVAVLAATGADHITDTVSGTAAPGTEVHVWSDDGSERVVTADPSGNWTADFSVEQNGQPVVDLVIGSTGSVWVSDDDGDQTSVGWQVVVPACQPGNTVSGTVFEHDKTTPVVSANIQFEDFNTGDPLFAASTDQNGQFGCFLPNGDYRVQAWTDGYGYSIEYYNEAIDVTAARLQITSGTQLTGINFTISPAAMVETITFNLQRPLLQDPVIRQSIALGTDRQRILDNAFLPNGIYGMVSNSITPPDHWVAAPVSELELYPFDPAQARAILTTAGWIDRDGDGYRENTTGDELSFTFRARNTSFRMASGAIFQENMADIGIRITTEYLPNNSALVNKDFDIFEVAWVGDYDNELNLNMYYSNSSTNYGSYANPVYDTALDNARAASGDAAKLPYLYQAQGILSQDLPVLPLFTRNDVIPVDTPAGTNITVSPEPWLTIHYAEVTDPGVTGVVAMDFRPPDLWADLKMLGQLYNIGTSAQFTDAQVCFSYDDAGLTSAEESTVAIYHLENDVWTDVTDDGYPDTVNNIVCGTVTGFSPFAILHNVMLPYPFDKTSPANGATNQPRTLTLKWGASSNADSYEYCYDTLDDDLCNTTWISAGAATSAVISGLAYNKTYYWQVKAVNIGGGAFANGGEWWTFKTLPLKITKAFTSSGLQDGWILESTETSNKGGTLNIAAPTISLGDNAQKKQYRGILSFNTSSLPDNAVITKVTLKVKKQGILGGVNPVTALQGFMLDVRKGFFGTTSGLVVSDFQAAASKTFGPFKPGLVNSWYSIDLTGAKAYINKLSASGGLTQVRLRFKLDDNNNAIANILNLYSGNAPLASRPQLIIEYYVP